MPTVTYVGDTYIVSTTPTDNFVGANPLVIQWATAGPSTTRLLATANFGGALPQVSSAILTLTNANTGSSGQSAWVDILNISRQSFAPSLATWNTYDGSNAWPGGAGAWDDRNSTTTPVSFNPPTGAVGTQVNVDITSLWNQAATEGYTWVPIIMRFQTEGTSTRTAYIQGNGDTTPMFITYLEPVPAGTSNLMTGGLRKLAGSIS